MKLRAANLGPAGEASDLDISNKTATLTAQQKTCAILITGIAAAIIRELGGEDRTDRLRQDANVTHAGLPYLGFDLDGSVKSSVQFQVRPGTDHTFNLRVALMANGEAKLTYFLAYKHSARPPIVKHIGNNTDMTALAKEITRELTLPVDEKR